ncbi:aldehyde dehydrogenase family protein [Streptomyces sp. NPDC002143]
MRGLTHDAMLRRAKDLNLPAQHHIDGMPEPGGGATFTVVSPRDGQVLGEVADARPAEVDLAVAAARRAFDAGPWPRLAPADRGRILLRIAELLEEQRETLALTISLEMGKPITDAHDIELRAAITTFRWYGQLADKLTDESPHTAPDALAPGHPRACRGLQVVNVALGGSLEQDMGGPEHEHRHLVHPVEIERRTLLEQATGAQKVESFCCHHQRMSTLAAGLAVTARAVDGTVEGLELPVTRGWFTAVQWHPEDTAPDDPAQQGIFDALARAARDRR